MSRRFYKLPPLTTLTAFEAAARHLSFKNAAQELSVTPGAVSHQIKALEAELGTPLFARRHRGVELTAAGEELFDTLASSFAKMSRCLRSIQARHDRDSVTLGSTSAVAALWLSPMVIRFWRSAPDVDVNQVIQDSQPLNTPDIDLFVHYGRLADARLTQAPLFRDVLAPVADPATARRLTGASLADLAGERLIHLETENRNWTTWQDWFAALGYAGPIAPGMRVNNYAVALQAAQEGAGIAIGWQQLIRPLLAAGQLHPIAPHRLNAPHRFHLSGGADVTLSDAARKLKAWIVAETAAASDEVGSPLHED